MRNIVIVAASLVCASNAAGAAEADCQTIVAATLAEMEAGATNWDARSAELARAAAGAACVKALSGTYAAGTEMGNAQSEAASASAEAKESGDESAAGDDVWPTLKRNDISGSPNKKPYERARN